MAKAKGVRWAKANPERVAAKARRYWSRNPEKRKIADLRKHAKRAGAVGTFTRDEFLALCESYGWLCVYCTSGLTRQTATADHLVPLVSSGRNDILNIVPSCRRCNNRKYSKPVVVFLADRLVA